MESLDILTSRISKNTPMLNLKLFWD